MTYKQIVDRLREIVFRHKMLVDFGYGDLSDIKVKSQNDTDKGSTGADYPYAFLNPSSHSRTENSMVYRFNLIVMEMSSDDTDAVLMAQSNCQQYIDDIVAMWHFGYQEDRTEVTLNYSLTPFKQRFQDTVAGMTALLEITVAKPIDNCLAPFIGLPPAYNLLVHAEATQDYYINPRTGSISPTESQVLWFNSAIQNDGGWNSYQYTAQNLGTHKFEVEFQMTLTAPNEPSESVGPAPTLLQVKNGVATYIDADTTTGWPTAYVDTTTVYTVKQTWTIDIEEPLATTYEYVRASDIPGIIELQFIEKAGSFIKIYKQA